MAFDCFSLRARKRKKKKNRKKKKKKKKKKIVSTKKKNKYKNKKNKKKIQSNITGCFDPSRFNTYILTGDFGVVLLNMFIICLCVWCVCKSNQT
jgi:hypothetical protein